MIRRLLCLLGFHKWRAKTTIYCYAPDDYYLSKECRKMGKCTECNYFSRKGYICEFCGERKE